MVNNKAHCPSGSTPYVIKAGDTFYKIAGAHNITVDELMKANPGVNPDRLFIGQIICIPSGTPTPPPSSKCPTLRMGNRGADVVRLQQLLSKNGFNPGAFDGIFGSDTHNAVIRFQRSKGLTADGIVGVNTWTALGEDCGSTPTPPPSNTCPTLRMGSRGPDVVRLQRLLSSHGFNPGAFDGIFGSNTQNAVIRFQRSKGLTADGIVGVDTWTALGENCGTTPPPSKCPSGTFAYTIRQGDTLYNLANRYNTTVDAIMKANPGINPNALQIGQVICIPSGSTPTPPPGSCPSGTFPYTIRSGDTLYILANRYNTTVDAIMKANPGINPNSLQIGQTICIPNR